MRYAIPLTLLAAPAWAHHEAVVVSVLPSLLPLILAGSAAVLAFWRVLRSRK